MTAAEAQHCNKQYHQRKSVVADVFASWRCSANSAHEEDTAVVAVVEMESDCKDNVVVVASLGGGGV